MCCSACLEAGKDVTGLLSAAAAAPVPAAAAVEDGVVSLDCGILRKDSMYAISNLA